MLARLLRRLLLIELVFYVVLGWCLVRFTAWSAPQAAALALGWAIAVRGLGIAAAFALAARNAGPAPPERRIGFFGCLKLYCAELAAYVLFFNLYQPFAMLFSRAHQPCPASAGRLPVLLLHGYICNRGVMLPLLRFLAARSVSAYWHELEPVYAGIDSYCGALAQRIEEICAATGAGQVIIVGHSMGGLAGRAYLRTQGAARVAKLITLGTPHHGTELARLCAGENARQMVPGSAWLERLNQHVLTVPAVSVFSRHDNIVSPQDSAVLAGANNVELFGIGHLTLALSRRVGEIVLEEIQAVAR